jgi:hypothetical protein
MIPKGGDIGIGLKLSIFADFSKTSFRKMGTIPAAEPKPKTNLDINLDIIILTA